MEQLPQLGTAISDIVGPTHGIYSRLLQQQAEKIRSTKCATFTYGSHARQKLDWYSPSQGAKPVNGEPNSVLIFLYGGGLVRGDKSNKEHGDGLVYANLGHWFAEHLGFPVAIVDYRLISHGAKFPSGGEDLKTAVDWILQRHAGNSTAPLRVYLMGNSAGGVHVSTYLLASEFAESRRQIASGSTESSSLEGVILLAVPFHFGLADPSRQEVLTAYFGTDISATCPLGLLRAAKESRSIDDLRHTRVLSMTGALDPEDEILTPNSDFEREWRACSSVASNLKIETIQGHNHISPVLSLGTGVPAEEDWGRLVVDFISS